MSAEQRAALRTLLRGTDSEPVIPFAQPGSLTKVFAIASGKGGVGKSSVTANLAVAMAADGLKVGIVDADIYGFSIPRMLGVTRQPTRVDDMLLPPEAFGVLVVSIGMFVPPGQPVVWRGPMLHRALQQFLADVFWGDLDVLLLDLPPGTGRHRHLRGAAAAELRDRRGHHPAGRRRRGRRAGRVRRRADPAARGRRRGEHVVARAARRLAARRCSAPVAGRPSPTTSRGSPAATSRCSGRCRSTCACARPATRAPPWCSAPRTPPPRRRCRASRARWPPAAAASRAARWA